MSLTIDQRLEQMTAAQHAAAADSLRMLRDLARRVEHVPARCMDLLDAQEELRRDLSVIHGKINGVAATNMAIDDNVRQVGKILSSKPTEPPWPARAESMRPPESEAERFQRWVNEVRPSLRAAAFGEKCGTPDDPNDIERKG